MTKHYLIIDDATGYQADENIPVDFGYDGELICEAQIDDAIQSRIELGDDLSIAVILEIDILAAIRGEAPTAKNVTSYFDLKPNYNSYDLACSAADRWNDERRDELARV